MKNVGEEKTQNQILSLKMRNIKTQEQTQK